MKERKIFLLTFPFYESLESKDDNDFLSPILGCLHLAEKNCHVALIFDQ